MTTINFVEENRINDSNSYSFAEQDKMLILHLWFRIKQQPLELCQGPHLMVLTWYYADLFFGRGVGTSNALIQQQFLTIIPSEKTYPFHIC